VERKDLGSSLRDVMMPEMNGAGLLGQHSQNAASSSDTLQSSERK
jgi:hypothetical protein